MYLFTADSQVLSHINYSEKFTKKQKTAHVKFIPKPFKNRTEKILLSQKIIFSHKIIPNNPGPRIQYEGTASDSCLLY